MAFRARRGVALMRHLVVGKRLLAQVSAMLQPTPRNPDRAALLEALTELRGAGITSASSTQEHQRMGTVSNQRASELPRRQLWVAYVVGAFGLGLAHQANFLTPLRAHELGASLQVIGLIVGAGSLVPAVTSVPLGRVIDRLGPRRSFIVSAAASTVVALLFVTVTNYWTLLVLQLVLGGVRTMGWLASQTYITSLGSPDDRAMLSGRFSFFTNVGTMVGPLMAGLVAQVVGFRLAFAWLAFYALVFAIIGTMLVETRAADRSSQRKGEGAGFGVAVKLLGVRGMQVALLLTFVRLWNEFIWSSFFPVHLVDIGFEPGVVGTVVFMKGLVATLLAPTVGYWIRFMSPQSLAALGLGFGALGLVVSPHVTALPWVYTASLLVGIGAGFSLPLLLAIIGDAVSSEQRGIALGLRMMVNQMAGGAAPVVVGPLIAALGVVLGFGSAGVFAGGLLIVARMLHASDRHVRTA